MTNKVYIEECLYNGKLFLQELFDKGSCILVIKFSLIKDRLSFYKNVVSGKKTDPFVIDMDIVAGEEEIEWLIRISFSQAYYKRDAEVIIFSSIQNPGLEEKFLKQGYTNVIILNPSTLPPVNIGKLYGYIFKLQNEYDWDLILTEFSDKSIPEKIETIQPDELFGNLNLHEQLMLAANKNKHLENLLSNYKTDLENYKSYLAIALKQKETENILEFYHNQYEVLPLWYKKFGHLLKILNGKRKIKS